MTTTIGPKLTETDRLGADPVVARAAGERNAPVEAVDLAFQDFQLCGQPIVAGAAGLGDAQHRPVHRRDHQLGREPVAAGAAVERRAIEGAEKDSSRRRAQRPVSLVGAGRQGIRTVRAEYITEARVGFARRREYPSRHFLAP